MKNVTQKVYKKSLAQKVRRKTDILERRRKGSPLQSSLCLRHGRWVTSKESLNTKNEYNVFHHKLEAKYFCATISSKNAVFSVKIVKNDFRGTFDYFLK